MVKKAAFDRVSRVCTRERIRASVSRLKRGSRWCVCVCVGVCVCVL